MITLLPLRNAKSRTFGWVQDPSNFRSLCDVVAVFDHQTPKHTELVTNTLPDLILVSDGRDDLIDAMLSTPLEIKYSHLVGTSFTPRSASRCNGIVQAAVKGQGRDFIGDWPADNFVRWAHCLGFIKYDYTDDTFSITDVGRELTAAYTGSNDLSEREREIITDSILAYPPAIRVLSLLSTDNAHMTKFEIGKQLGFIGEGGFGSMPQSVLIRALSQISNASERNKMKADWEGASDKYARMIARWLSNLGLVEQIGKTVTVDIGRTEHSEVIGQAYRITAQGITALNRSLGRSRHARIKKNICYEMLATKGADREYLRTRRALIIKRLSERRRVTTVEEIASYLDTQNITASNEAIRDDVQGLTNIGLEIEMNGNGYIWRDSINDFVIPIRERITQSSTEQMKDELREIIIHIPHDYLSLIDLAYDSSQNRLFEMKTLELLTEECGYEGLHLGGSRKPDGIIYTDELAYNYGVIIDTKSYSGGYNLPIGQADEMQRYIQENQRRDEHENPNKWWENFGDDVQQFYFMFVSGHFIGRYQEQIDRVSRITETPGAAVEISKLLLTANDIKSNAQTLADVETRIFEGYA